jgi:hypothetical protein
VKKRGEVPQVTPRRCLVWYMVSIFLKKMNRYLGPNKQSLAALESCCPNKMRADKCECRNMKCIRLYLNSVAMTLVKRSFVFKAGFGWDSISMFAVSIPKPGNYCFEVIVELK